MAEAQQDTATAARALAAKRWEPSPVVARAVQTVVSRSGELDDAQRAELRQVIEEAHGE